MGQKVHPYGLRLGIIRQAKSTWFAEGPNYRQQLIGDLRIRQYIDVHLLNANVSDVRIERSANAVTVTIETGKPGIVIGRGGRDVERLRKGLEALCAEKVRVNVEETKDPDTNASLVAQNIARQIERRVSFRRAIRQAMDRAMKLGAKGVRCMVSGRLQGAEIARSESMGPEGRVPLHTLRADVEYGLAEAKTGYGHIGVKVWVYKGEILPPRKVKPTDMYEPEDGEVEEGGEAVAETQEQAPDAAVSGEAPQEQAGVVQPQGAPEGVEAPQQAATAAVETAQQAAEPAVETPQQVATPAVEPEPVAPPAAQPQEPAPAVQAPIDTETTGGPQQAASATEDQEQGATE